MATEAQIAANRANAQKSTGPTTAEGRAASAKNAYQHGLAARDHTIFNLHPEEQTKLDDLRNRLRKELVPKTELEENAFQAYAYSLFQAGRARTFEAAAQEEWLMDPGNEKLLKRMESLTAYRHRMERGAERNIKELGRFQLDRLCHNKVIEVLEKYGHDNFPSLAIPMFELRRKHFKHATGLHIGDEFTAKWRPREPEPRQTKKKKEAEKATLLSFADFLPPDAKAMRDDLKKWGYLK